MAFFTTDKSNPDRKIPIQAIRSAEFPLSTPNTDTFTLMILSRGVFTCTVDQKAYAVPAPAVVCFDERLRMSDCGCRQLEARLLCFNPVFLNRNMTIAAIRSEDYGRLVQDYSYFQLSPFLGRDFGRQILPVDADTLAALTDSFDGCRDQLRRQPDWYWTCRARSYLIDIVSRVERLYNQEAQPCEPAEPRELKEIASFVQNHLDLRLTLDLLSGRFHLYPQKIEHLFRTYCNTTFHEYVSGFRLERITYYLLFTDLTAKEIALRVGLSNSQNLCKFFKSRTGESPNDFRSRSLSARKSAADGGLADECGDTDAAALVTA